MGSPLSPIAADIAMDDLETKCIASLPFQLPFFFRYVDDIITAVPTDKIDTILNTFNSYNHKIKFTIEDESDGKICFLDVLIIRNGEKIKTNWYQKPTCSGRLLNFYSHHPLSYKINVINHLVDRGITLAHITFDKENIQKIKTILLNNNYPINFINHVIKNRIKHLQKKNTNKGFPPRNENNLSNFFKSAKDNISKLDTADVVYNIPCTGCTASYIGTTKRPLKTRITEHKKYVFNPPDKWTALIKHAWNQDHKFDFNAVNIVDRSSNYKKRMILEMTHVASKPHVVNQRTDTENLSVFYLPLLSN